VLKIEEWNRMIDVNIRGVLTASLPPFPSSSSNNLDSL